MRPIEGTGPGIVWEPMDGVPVMFFEDLNGDGKGELQPSKLPTKVRAVIAEIQGNLSRIYYSKSFVSFHCWRRRYKLRYVVEEIGSCGWLEMRICICPVCGNKKERIYENLSGVPF